MAWGGKRPGAGRKANPNVITPKRAATLVPDKPPLIPAEARKDFPAIDPRALQQMLPEIEEISKRYALQSARNRGQDFKPFKFPEFPPKALPPKSDQMAQDSALCSANDFGNSEWLAAASIGGLSGEGLLFLGYAYLSQLAQRPEYRVISETIADDATRKWIDFDVTGDEAEQAEKKRREQKDPKGEAERQADPDERQKRIVAAGKLDKVKALKDDQLRLDVKGRYYDMARGDGFFGRMHLFHDIQTGEMPTSDEELKTPIGDGRDATSKTKITKGSFKALRAIEPIWTYPLAYNAINPLREDWYNPQTWYVMGKQIHGSRIPTFIGHPVPDILKPSYSFGGLSLSQMAKPYVDIWLTTRESVGQLIHSFSVMVLMTDLSTLMQPGNVNALLARVAMFNMLRDNQGTFVVNKNTEDFKNVSASLAGLHELQAQSQEHMASVARIPLVKFTGIQPSGLNASSEGEIAIYDDTISAYQERFFRPNLTRTINFEQLSLWEEIDPEITYHFQSLRQPTEAEKGELQKKQAERDQIYVDGGAISPAEWRKAIIDDPDLPFADLDPDDVPEPPEQDDGFGGGEGGPDGGGDAPPKPEGGAADEQLDPFSRRRPLAQDEWNEGDHPRGQPNNAGQFGPGGGGSSSSKLPPVWAAKGPKNFGKEISKAGLKRVGKQMGSNPGGVFEDADGRQFYVKEGKSKDHVKNELIAAALYGEAGTPTLTYHPVEGGDHIATKMSKLSKANANEFSERERREAKRDFAVHAWLGNWDAAGMGGDNLGTVKGVPTALDVGGALEYRAQGAPKGKAFGKEVTELGSLRDKAVNRDTHKLFGDMTPAEMRESARYVTQIPDARIRSTVEKLGGDPKLADKLIARKEDIARQAATFGAEGEPEKKTSTVVFPAGEKLPVKELNGVPFKAWSPPRDWANVEGQIDIHDEPEFNVPEGKKAASGLIIREPDGRVWIVRPTRGYGGYEHTFPKGRAERDLSLQANAIKEGFEESGLKGKITGFAGDVTGDLTHTRFYYAEREGGDPSKHEDESDGVVLAPADKLDGFLNRGRDKKVASLAMDEAPWDESKHPRAPDGKFGSGGGSSNEAVTSKEGVEALAEISALLKKAPIAGANYRKALVKALKNPALTEQEAQKLGANLIASWTKTGVNAASKGDHKSAEAIVAKIKKLGGDPESVLVAQLNAPTKPDAETQAMLDKLKAAGKPAEKPPEKKDALAEAQENINKQAEKNAGKQKAISEGVEKMTKAIDTLVSGKTVEAVEAAGTLAQSLVTATPVNTTPPSAAELAKAEKTVALQVQYVPNLPKDGPFSMVSSQLVSQFNEKYADKKMDTPEKLKEKVAAFKTLNDMGATLTKMQTAVEGKIVAEAKLKAQETANKQAAAAKKKAAEAAEKNKKIIEDLGISEQQAEAVVTLAGMLGKSTGDLVTAFKAYEEKAKAHGYPITGFQAALISNYSNGGYHSINDKLREGAWTKEQHAYVALVNKALLAMPKHTGKLIRNTSLTPEQIAGYKEGHVMLEQAFMSTSTKSVFGGNVRFNVTAIGKRGASIKKLSNHASEDEVLFAAKTFFHVDKVEKGSGGHVTIHMTEWESHE